MRRSLCRLLTLGAVLAAWLALDGSARAASITWSNVVNIVSDSDVATNDYLEYAYFYSSSGNSEALNGVPFKGSGGSKNLGANVTTTFPAGGGSVSGMGDGTGLSAEYQTVLGGCAYYDGSATATVTLNNLNTGGRYFVQIWINDGRSIGSGRTATVTSPGGNTINFDYNLPDAVGGRGQCAVGTFVADGATQTFTIQSAISAQLNALQLRSIPVTNFTVSVNATQAVRTVDSRVFGVNTALYDSSLAGNGTIPLMTELGVKATRWPGGSYGDTFLISTEYLREPWQARTTNFINIVKTIGADSFIIANYGTGTPEDAVDFLRYVNITNQAGAKYWEIGNEIPGTWEADWRIPAFKSSNILDLVSFANKLYTPTNNVSTWVRSTLSESTLTTLSNYIADPGTYDSSLRAALAGELNGLVNTASASSIYKSDTNRFAGVTFRAVTWTNLSLPIPNAGQDLNNRMVLEDAYPELEKITPAINYADSWPDVHLPHDPWTYAQRFKEYYDALKAVDPTIKIGSMAEGDETAYGNGYTHHFAVNPRTGTTNYGWMPVMLDTMKKLGVKPDFTIYHNYAGSGDAALLQWSKRLTNDAANVRQMLNDYLGTNEAASIEQCITEVGPADAGQTSTSLVGGLFMADNTGQCLQSEFNARLWWSFRNGASAQTNTTEYGWRFTKDYGVVLTSLGQGLRDKYPTFYCLKLMQYFARGGDTVVTANSPSSLLSTYAVKRQDGSLTLLVINKSPDLNLTGNFNLAGHLGDTNLMIYSYGIPQDDAARYTNGSPDIAVSSVTVTNSASLSLAFAPYSASVVVVPPVPAIVTNRYQTLITFTNYNRGEVLTNFPVLVVLNTNRTGFKYGTFASPTAADLRFKSGDGSTVLNFEIEKWNPQGDSHVWVQVPRFTNNCAVLAQWGGFDGVVPPASLTNGSTWSNGFIGVWHLDETAGLHRDSSTSQAAARFASAVSQGYAAGVASGCDNFDGTYDYNIGGSYDYVSLADMGTNSQVTVECWARLNAVPPDTLRGLVSSDPWRTGITHFRCNNSLQVQAANYSGVNLTSAANAISVGQWFYTGYVMAGTGANNFRLFLNGAQIASGNGAAANDLSDVNLARESGDGRYLNARLDEVRISNMARSTNWLWATYLNIASNNTFNSHGPVSAIGNANVPPVLSPIGNQTANELNLFTFTATATDADPTPQTLTFSLDPGAPAGASITTNGVFTWTPAELEGPGTYPVTLRVSDGLSSDFETFQIVVNEASVPPVLAAIGNQAVNEWSLLTFTATATDTDLPAQTLTFSLDPGAPAGASITTDGVFTWTPTEAQGPGTNNITVRVSDGLTNTFETIQVVVIETDPVLSRTTITFSGYNRTEVLTNLPVLVVFGTNLPGFGYSQFATPNAADLRFRLAKGGTNLNYEVDQWNPNGQSRVWVQVPHFSNNCALVATWGDATITNPPASTTNGATWSAGYMGVWHLNDASVADSTSRGHGAEANTSTVSAGLVGSGAQFGGSEYIRIPWSADFNLATNMEIQGWFRVAAADKVDFLPLTAKQGSADFNNRNWWLALRADGKLWWKNSGVGGAIDTTNSTDLAISNWHHFSAVHDGAAARLYINGVQAAVDSSPGANETQAEPVFFGHELGTARYFKGMLDELRISNTKRSSNWVWAVYQNIASNNTFASYASVVTNTPPVLTPIPDQVIGAGVPLLLTNLATDSDVPAQLLTFSLPAAPPGAFINATNGVLSWRPSVAQAGTTNLVQVVVADNGFSSLSATQSFNVIVNPVNRPSVSSAQFTNSQFRLTINGDYGPDYTVQASTNLVTWASVLTTNSPVLPFPWADVDATNFPRRFYRVLLGP